MEINGTKVVSIESLVEPVYKYFGLSIGDENVIKKIISLINSLINSHDIEKIQPYVWDIPNLNISNLKRTVYHAMKDFNLQYIDEGQDKIYKIDIETTYSKWIETYGSFIFEVAKLTKEEDPTLQHWLNYEDFIQELKLTQKGNEILVNIYELRGLDFFLIHYMGGETLAIDDSALFTNVDCILDALKSIARYEEAIVLEQEIDKRKKGIKKIQNKYAMPDFESKHNTTELMRVQAEKFWVEYFSNQVWKYMQSTSRTELIDSFITESFLENGILQNWSQVALLLCKVIEREISETFFFPWITEIKKSNFTEPKGLSKTQTKKIQARRYTYETLKKCAAEPIQSPTLGQILFMCKFWNDPIMDDCTNLFINIRNKLNHIEPKYSENVTMLAQFIEEKNVLKNEQANIVELRNASAHPGREQDLDWKKHINWLKIVLGKPPKHIIKLITVTLRPAVLYTKQTST